MFTNTAVKYADSKISDDTNITVDAKISVTAYAFKKNILSPITDITFTDMSEEELSAQPSMVLYIVKPGDSLLKIAKKYNSRISDITTVNKIDPNTLTPGTKLLIIKPTL
ncbi:MAG: LysM peptidoglycan-binding domain-containing protein [Clostridiales bacterium]|nr:LysM peptidoglycan-binding domain-containing protein [Clostridiales bacterium]